MEILRESYKSITEFVNVISNRPTNKVFKGKAVYSSQAAVYGDIALGTPTYEVACQIAAEGYQDTLSKITAEKITVTHSQDGAKATQAVSVVGYTPHVPNAVMGVPMAMITRTQQPIKQKIITIKYSLGLSGKESPEKFEIAGTNLLGLIKSLELQGYRVALEILKITFGTKQVSVCSVNLKEWKQPINPLKLTYPLTHPSFYRRHFFRHIEGLPTLTDTKFGSYYGYPIHSQIPSVNAQRDWIKAKGLLAVNEFYVDTNTAAKFKPAELAKEMKIS